MKSKKPRVFVVIKDIVIKKGTLLEKAPWKTERDGTHFDCTIGLSDNTHGTFEYCIDPDYEGEVSEYFLEITDSFQYKEVKKK